MRILPIAVLSLFLLTGCAWLERPLDPAVGVAVDEAQLVQVDIAARMTALENAISGLEYNPDLTPAEADVLVDMRETLKTLQESMADVGAWLAVANETIDNSATNEDAILDLAATLAAAFGLPFVGFGVPLWRSMRKSGKLKAAIVNLESNKDEDGVVDWDKLRIDNADSGLNTVLKTIREG